MLDAPASVQEGDPYELTVYGSPGGFVVLIASAELPQRRYLGPAIGVLHPRSPLQLLTLGPIPASAQLVVPLVAPDLPPGIEAATEWIQVFTSSPAGRYLSNPRSLTVLDDSL